MLKTSQTVGELGRMPDTLSEAMVATAAAYFVNGAVAGSEQPNEFRQTMHNLWQQAPFTGKYVLAAALARAGFKIESDPIMVDTPDVPPGEALGRPSLLWENGDNVGATLIDVGVEVLDRGGPRYDEQISEAVFDL